MERYERIPDVIIDSDKKDIYIVLYKGKSFEVTKEQFEKEDKEVEKIHIIR